jgi:beta-glucanase (GH16 family)
VKGQALLLIAAGGLAFLALLISAGSKVYTFQDEFNGPAGSAPDHVKWSYDVGGGGWGNNELQTYTDSRANSFLDGNGNLVIRATRTVSSGQTNYMSARLKTLGHFAQAGGSWEARIKIDSQRGLWPAWWMLGQDCRSVGWPQCGEVDIVEDYGFSTVESSVHTVKDSLTHTTHDYSNVVSIDKRFHVFRLDWTPVSLTFFKDGVKYAEVAQSQIARNSQGFRFDRGTPMFMLFNLAVGGNIGNPSLSTHFPVDLVIDYVRVWS